MIKSHKNGGGNIAEAMTKGSFQPAGRMDHRKVPDLINNFQNTPLKGSLR